MTKEKNIQYNPDDILTQDDPARDSLNNSEQNPFIKYQDILIWSDFFKKLEIKKWELLFDEWEQDSNIYIIYSGSVSVEKYTTTEKISSKQLAILQVGDFFGEASMGSQVWEKEVLIKTLDNTSLYYIDGKKDLQDFLAQNMTIGYEILRWMILITNKRLLESNRLITGYYEIQNTIISLKDISSKSIFQLIGKIKQIVEVDYILYFEKHQILEKFLTFKYDTRIPNVMQDKVFERAGSFLDLDNLLQECNIDPEEKVLINKLSIGNETLWFIIFWRKNQNFSLSDKKVLSSLGVSFSWVIKQLFTLREINDKRYITESRNI